MPYFTGESRLQDVLFERQNVKAFTNIKVKNIISENDEFKGINVENTKEQTTFDVYCDGMFVAIGLIPENKPFENLANLNTYGYFDSDESCTTKTQGIFVAGDCRSKRIRQVATAISDGAVAALAACNYINQL